MHCVCVVIARDCLLAKDPSGSSSDDGGFLPGAEAEGVGDSGHTLPVRNSRSVQSMSWHDVVGILFALGTPPRAVDDSPSSHSEECNLYLLSGCFACLIDCLYASFLLRSTCLFRLTLHRNNLMELLSRAYKQ